MAALLRKKPSLSYQAFSVRGSGPQGLRRPRFSFFRFTCQTPRNLAAPPPANARAAETPRIRHGHKIMAGCSFTVNSEGLRRRAIAPKRAARRRVYIGFGRRHCQRPHRQNARCEFVDEAAIFTASAAARQSPGAVQRLAAMSFGAACAALRPHSSAVLCTIVSGTPQCGGTPASANFSTATVGSVDRAAAGIVLRF